MLIQDVAYFGHSIESITPAHHLRIPGVPVNPKCVLDHGFDGLTTHCVDRVVRRVHVRPTVFRLRFDRRIGIVRERSKNGPRQRTELEGNLGRPLTKSDVEQMSDRSARPNPARIKITVFARPIWDVSILLYHPLRKLQYWLPVQGLTVTCNFSKCGQDGIDVGRVQESQTRRVLRESGRVRSYRCFERPAQTL